MEALDMQACAVNVFVHYHFDEPARVGIPLYSTERRADMSEPCAADVTKTRKSMSS